MERTMISFNLPNWITVMVMALGLWVGLAAVRQLMLHNMGGGATPTSSLGGY